MAVKQPNEVWNMSPNN